MAPCSFYRTEIDMFQDLLRLMALLVTVCADRTVNVPVICQ